MTRAYQQQCQLECAGPSGYAMMHIRLYMHEGNQASGEKHLEIAARYSRIAMRRVYVCCCVIVCHEA